MSTQTTEQAYMEKWIALNNQMRNRHFIWGALEENDDYEQYMAFNIYQMTQKQWTHIQTATKKIGHIMHKTYIEIMKNKELINRLGLPIETSEAIAILSDYFSYFTRMDLIVNNENVKVIEVNCDTPTGYLETAIANKIICEDQGYTSPNTLEAAITKAWKTIVKTYGITANDTVYFSSYAWHDEDRETVLFNMKHSQLANVKYIDIGEIIVADDGIYDDDGQRIHYLYRLYPLEYLPDDTDENGKKIGNLLLDHIATGRVTIINPPSAFLMQSKAIMAIIWDFYEKKRLDLFTPNELNDIKTFFLPTYFTDQPFTSNGLAFVEKPIFGREGGGVRIFDDKQLLIDEDQEHWYNEWSKIYQQYMEMPDYTVDTWTGPYTGKLLMGSFLIGGEPSGLFLRVGEKITGNLSMFCGITVTQS